MLNDGSGTVSITRATIPDVKEKVKKLKNIQNKLWAVLGLKMACDSLRSLGYDVVVRQAEGRTTIEVELKVDFDFDTGLVGGKDVVAVETELKSQIEALEGKNGKA